MHSDRADREGRRGVESVTGSGSEFGHEMAVSSIHRRRAGANREELKFDSLELLEPDDGRSRGGTPHLRDGYATVPDPGTRLTRIQQGRESFLLLPLTNARFLSPPPPGFPI